MLIIRRQRGGGARREEHNCLQCIICIKVIPTASIQNTNVVT